MAELLVRVTENLDARGNSRPGAHYGPGDVISICPDGWPWSKDERNNPNWRIIAVDDSSSALKHLVEADEVEQDGARTLRAKRKRRVNLDTLPHKELYPRPDIDAATELKAL